MRQAGIGRILVASLHQAIADQLPVRLEFYENWLNAEGLRNGRIGLAQLAAVLSFLRQEGGAYDLTTTRAGVYAAEWTVAGMSSIWRSIALRLPAPVRARVALSLARQVVRRSHAGSRARLRLRGSAGRLDIRGSLFCGVRQKAEGPLCGFYAAATARVLRQLNVTADVRITECLAVGGRSCHVAVVIERSKAQHEHPDQAAGSGQ